jgi:hypothetical protein
MPVVQRTRAGAPRDGSMRDRVRRTAEPQGSGDPALPDLDGSFQSRRCVHPEFNARQQKRPGRSGEGVKFLEGGQPLAYGQHDHRRPFRYGRL